MITSHEELEKYVDSHLPEFSAACRKGGVDAIVLHQDAFSIRETDLLGAAVKYAGWHKKKITIIPTP